MLSIIGAYLGINVVNAVRAALVAVTLSTAALGVGYVKGRVDGAAIATANAAWLAEDMKEKDGANSDAASVENREAITKNETTEKSNDDVEHALLAPDHNDSRHCIDDGWVQDLGKLR